MQNATAIGLESWRSQSAGSSAKSHERDVSRLDRVEQKMLTTEASLKALNFRNPKRADQACCVKMCLNSFSSADVLMHRR